MIVISFHNVSFQASGFLPLIFALALISFRHLHPLPKQIKPTDLLQGNFLVGNIKELAVGGWLKKRNHGISCFYFTDHGRKSMLDYYRKITLMLNEPLYGRPARTVV